MPWSTSGHKFETGLGASPYRSDTSREQDSIGARLSGTFDLFGRAHELIAGYSRIDQSYVADGRPPLQGTVAPIGNFNEWDGSYPEPTYGPASIDIDEDTKQSGFYVATRLSVTEPLKVVAGGRLATWEPNTRRRRSSDGALCVHRKYLGAKLRPDRIL